MLINLELYRIFYTTAKLGSISKAAKELFTSQPAVSQSIKSLEKKLEGQLFYRTPNGVILTSEGEILFKYIEQGYALMQTAEKKFFELKNMNVGQLRIAVCSSVCKNYLLDYLEKYCVKYPNIKIFIKDKSSKEIVKALEIGEVDIGIINLNLKYKNMLHIFKTFKIHDCFVAGSRFSEINNRQISIKELTDNYPIILLEEKGNTRSYINDYFSLHEIELEPQMELSNLELLIEFAKRGLGVSCVVKEYVQEELKQNQLFEVSIAEKIPERIMGVSVVKDFPLSTATQKFIELISDEQI